MKTDPKLTITYEGYIFEQNTKSKMLYVDRLLGTAVKFEDNPRLATNKEFSKFWKLKDTQSFVSFLKEYEGLTDEHVLQGRWATKRIHELLAIKYCTWISKKFELFVYKFFLEKYPRMRELWWDRYNEFRNTYLPRIQHKGNLKETVIKMNIYINSCLEKENGRNKETKENYVARVYIYENIYADIEMWEKPTTRETVIERLQKKVDFYAQKAKIIYKNNPNYFAASMEGGF